MILENIKTLHEQLVVVQSLESYIAAEDDNVLLIHQRLEEFVADIIVEKGVGYR